MKYSEMTDQDLIKMIGGGAQNDSPTFLGCSAELQRRLSEKSVSVAVKALWVASVSAFAALCSAVSSIANYF